MPKAIYALKIYLFRESFKLTAKEEKELIDICIFLVDVYLTAWFTASLSSKVPHNDLSFVQQLHAYQSTDPVISEVALRKFCNHLWYLSPETAAMAFFEDQVSDIVKRTTILASRNEEEDVTLGCPNRFQINVKDIANLYAKDWTTSLHLSL